MKKIILIENNKQQKIFNEIKEKEGFLHGCKIVTFGRRKGLEDFEIIDEYSYIAPSALFKLALDCQRLTERFIAIFKEYPEFSYKGINLVDCCYHSIYYFLYYLIRNKIFFERLINIEKPNVFYLFNSDRKTDNIIPDKEESFVKHIVQDVCTQRNITLHQVPCPEEKNSNYVFLKYVNGILKNVIKKSFIAASQLNFDSKKHSTLFLGKYQLLRKEILNENLERKNILCPTIHFDFSNFGDLFKEKVVLCNIKLERRTACVNFPSLNLLKKDNEWLSLDTEYGVMKFVQYRWQQLTGAFLKSKEYLKTYECFISRKNITRIVFDQDVGSYTKPFAKLAQNKRIKTVVICHGAFSYRTVYPGYLPLTSDKIVCFDNSLQKELIKAGCDEKKIEVDTHILDFVTQQKNLYLGNTFLKNKYKRTRGRYIYVICHDIRKGFSRGIAQRDYIESDIEKYLEDIVKVFDEFKDQFDKVIVKLHPGETDILFYQNFLEKKLNKESFEVILKGDNIKLMHFSKCIISVYSTCIFEAMKLDKKVICVDYPGIYEHLSFINKEPLVYYAKNLEEIRKAMQQIA